MGKVLHLTKTLHGGGGQYAFRLSNALTASNCPSSIHCLDDNSLAVVNNHERIITSLTDRVVSSAFNRFSCRPYHTFFRLSKWAIEPTIYEEDIVHLHSITGFIGFRGLSHALRVSPLVFWTAHNPWLFTGGCVAYAGCDRFTTNCRSCPILKQPVKFLARTEYALKRLFLDEFDVKVIANSKWMADLMKRSPIFENFPDIPIVPPIVDSAFSTQRNRYLARSILNISEDQFVIALSASSLTDSGKGISEFFASFPQDACWTKNVIFLLIGDGMIRLPSHISSIHVGRISEPSILADLYACSDLFVSPSFMETFGMAISEAQACGTPVIAFRTGGTPEAVYPAEPCLLLQNYDFNSLYDALEAAVLRGPIDSPQREAIARWTQDRLSATTIAKKQIAIYNGGNMNKR